MYRNLKTSSKELNDIIYIIHITCVLFFLANKKAKSSFIESPMNFLMKSLGGSNSVKKKSPMCGGYYNTTDGVMVVFIFAVTIFHLKI